MIDKILDNFRNNNISSDLNKDTLIVKKNDFYKEQIIKIQPIYLDPNTPDENIADSICIPNGDAQLPDDISMDEDVKKYGIESLAWYRSFHWKPIESWGIYILNTGINHIAQKIFFGHQNFNSLDCYQSSFKFLLYHEFFHYITDIAVSILEATHQFKIKLYENYYYKIYEKPNPLEEALANAYAYDNITRLDPGLKRKIHKFMIDQPPGYCDYHSYLNPNKFNLGIRNLTHLILNGIPDMEVKIINDIPFELLFDIHKVNLSFNNVPVYIIQNNPNPEFNFNLITTIPSEKLIISKRFMKDLKKLPNDIQKKFEKTKELLKLGINNPSLNWERIKGNDTLFSIRINIDYRASIKLVNHGEWELLRIDKHDALYDKPGK